MSGGDVDVRSAFDAAKKFAQDHVVECSAELLKLSDGENLTVDGYMSQLRQLCRPFAEYNAFMVAQSLIHREALRLVVNTFGGTDAPQ